VRDIDDEVDRETVLADLEMGNGSLVGTASAARTVARLSGSVVLQQTRQDAKDLQEYGRLNGDAMASTFRLDFPTLESTPVAMPSEFGNLVDIAATTPEAVDKNIASYVGNLCVHSGGESAMNSTIDRAFETMNAATYERDVPKGSDDAPREARWCRTAGMCLCQPSGVELRLLRESCYLELTKPIAKPKTENRAKLRDGWWLLRLTRGEALSLDKAPHSAGLGREIDTAEFYLHMGYHVITPWRPTINLVSLTDAPPGELPSGPDRIYTRVFLSIIYVAYIMARITQRGQQCKRVMNLSSNANTHYNYVQQPATCKSSAFLYARLPIISMFILLCSRVFRMFATSSVSMHLHGN
jgi:hypothetical protein